VRKIFHGVRALLRGDRNLMHRVCQRNDEAIGPSQRTFFFVNDFAAQRIAVQTARALRIVR